MSKGWEGIDNATVSKEDAELANKKRREEAVKLAKNYHRCFSTPEGMKVLEHMSKFFLIENDTSFESNNINYESAYHNGEAGVVRFILQQIAKAEKL